MGWCETMHVSQLRWIFPTFSALINKGFQAQQSQPGVSMLFVLCVLCVPVCAIVAMKGLSDRVEFR